MVKKRKKFLLCFGFLFLVASFMGVPVSANEEAGVAPRVYEAEEYIAPSIDQKTVPTTVFVGQQGQVRRTLDDPYYELEKSLFIHSYDTNLLRFDYSGKWTALAPGKTTVQIRQASPSTNPELAQEMAEKGFVLPTDTRPIPAILGFYRWEVTIVDASTLKPMYRLYNPANQEHFYTSDVHEKDTLVQRGWGRYEGIAWQAPAEGKAVYRLYNSGLRDHHYTSDEKEVEVLTRQYGWKKEGLAWYSSGTKEVYRLFHPGLTSGSHHYTSDKNEVTVLQEKGWRYEGLAWTGY